MRASSSSAATRSSIETGAGAAAGSPTTQYEANGARIASVDEVWESAELLLKVKEPIAPEYARLREGLVLFTYLHIAADEPLTRALVDERRHRPSRTRRSRPRTAAAAAGADERGRGPARRPGGRALSRAAARAAAGCCSAASPGVAPGKVVVIGGGIVGYNAAVIALGLGAQVTILERSVDRMRHLEEMLHGRVSLVMSSTLQIEESVADADLVIGAVLIPGALAPKLVTREMVEGDEAGLRSSATSRSTRAAASRPRMPTTHDDPVYVVDGVIHYCVANMPGAVPITSTMALTNVTLPYVEAIADTASPLRSRATGARAGVNVVDGKVTYEAVAEAHGLDYTPLEDVLARRPSRASRGQGSCCTAQLLPSGSLKKTNEPQSKTCTSLTSTPRSRSSRAAGCPPRPAAGPPASRASSPRAPFPSRSSTPTRRCQLDEPQLVGDLIVVVGLEADLFRVEALGAVDVRDGTCKLEPPVHGLARGLLRRASSCFCAFEGLSLTTTHVTPAARLTMPTM